MLKPKSIKFICLKDCSNCCSVPGGFVFLTEKEAEGAAEYLSMQYQEFIDHFTRQIDDELALMDGENEACVFLDKHSCLIYPKRPQQCRTFPFWQQNMKSEKNWEFTKKVCPGLGRGKRLSASQIGEILNGKTLDSKR